MNPRQFALFLGFYFYILNVNAANDAQSTMLALFVFKSKMEQVI